VYEFTKLLAALAYIAIPEVLPPLDIYELRFVFNSKKMAVERGIEKGM
jgi:hypothetical protein